MAESANQKDDDFECFVDTAYGDSDDFWNYADKMALLNFVIGLLNLLLFAIVVVYLAFSVWSKSKLNQFTWVGLLEICIILCLVGFSDTFYGQVQESKYCNFTLHIAYGVENIILFNLSLLIGYKVYQLSQDIFQFAFKGALPSERRKSRHKTIIRCIWTVSLCLLILFSTINFYYFFIHERTDGLRQFNFVFSILEPIFYMIVSAMFLTALFPLFKIRQASLENENQKPLKRFMMLIWTLLVTYTLVWSCCWWRIAERHAYDAVAFASQLIIRIAYIFMKVILVYLLINWQVDLSLKTQVLADGQILILGYDEHEREHLRFYMNHDVRASSSTVQENRNEVQAGFHYVKVNERDDLTSEGAPSYLSPTSKQYKGEQQSDFVSNYRGTCGQGPMGSIQSHSIQVEDNRLTGMFINRGSFRGEPEVHLEGPSPRGAAPQSEQTMLFESILTQHEPNYNDYEDRAWQRPATECALQSQVHFTSASSPLQESTRSIVD